VLAHDLYIIEDGTVRLHALTYAVFKRLKWYTKLEAMLNE
jgi:hypothetical protein